MTFAESPALEGRPETSRSKQKKHFTQENGHPEQPQQGLDGYKDGKTRTQDKVLELSSMCLDFIKTHVKKTSLRL